MKINRQNAGVLPPGRQVRGEGKNLGVHGALAVNPRSAFTMVEIAICLAIIGFALVAIIGVLPIGMNTQRDNREETVINQDATMFIEAIRNGARGLDDLTNYVYAISNFWTSYQPDGTVKSSAVNGYVYSNLSVSPLYFTTLGSPINNGTNIIGVLSTPEYMDNSGVPLGNIFNTTGYYSNHIVAYVRSLSGPAVEKPPQDNPIIQQDSFGYRILCVNAPVAVDTNIYNQQLTANLHELRLTFLWPELPGGSVGPSRQTWRTMVAGQIVTNIVAGQILYFYQPQSFVNAP